MTEPIIPLPKKKQKGTTKSQGKKHVLDKFYTKSSVAGKCLEKLELKEYSVIIEPSAGSGTFSDLLPNCEAYDLDPENKSIIKKDWFTYVRTRSGKDKVLVVGNPPFGQQNNLAIKFINHAAIFADTIAFILPLSFMKDSVQRRINSNFHLTYFEILAPNSFTLDGQDVNVPCVYQIWQYKKIKRNTAKILYPKKFSFVKKHENPDFFLQRVGGRAGSFGKVINNRSEQSNYFVKLDDKNDLALFEETLKMMTHPQRNLSLGPKSISKQEFLQELSKKLPHFVE